MRKLQCAALLCLFLAAGCGKSSDPVAEFRSRPVTLPDGTVIRAEVNTQESDMQRGMMFRDSLPEGQGMLFIHGSPGNYPYWMFNVRVPLDIIWMDARGTVVEVVENAQPCQKPAAQWRECPNYGGAKTAVVVLELPGGTSRKHGVAVGSTIRF